MRFLPAIRLSVAAHCKKSLFGRPPNVQGQRFLSLHEYISMGILQKHKVPVPRGLVATTADEALAAAKELGGKDVIVKAQVLAGGRGKGHFSNGFKGGVQICKNPKETADMASKMIGQVLITKQTGAAGKPCNSVYVCERLAPEREYYFAVLIDRKSKSPMIVGSTQGGMDIEAVAEATPEAIFKQEVDINKGLLLDEATSFALKAGFASDKATAERIGKVMCSLYEVFQKNDATLVEINPFAMLQGGKPVCMDAKLNIDDNADFRQAELFEKRDKSQEDPREVVAHEAKLNYIGLDGNIGCLVNGAGLAMATMDIIKLRGGEPANFLDVGGSATTEQVTDAFKLISSDPRVKAILVNIFGGIMRCDVIAEGVIQACRTLDLKIPLVVRLQGTKLEEALKLIKDSGLKIHYEEDLDKAARAAVKMSKT